METMREWDAKRRANIAEKLLKIFKEENMALMSALKKAEFEIKTGATVAALAAAKETKKIKLQNITNMLLKNFEPTIIADVLEIQLKEVLAVKKQLEAKK